MKKKITETPQQNSEESNTDKGKVPQQSKLNDEKGKHLTLRLKENHRLTSFEKKKTDDYDKTIPKNKCWAIFKRIQQIIFIIYDDPLSSWVAKLVNLVIFASIITSVLLVIIDSVDSWSEKVHTTSQKIEFAISIIFIVEYCTRIFSCTAFGDKIYWWAIRPSNLIDLFSIVPFILNLILDVSHLSSLVIIRTIRLTRMFRVIKLSKYMAGLDFLYNGLKKSLDSLGFLIIILIVAVIVVGTALFYAEFDPNIDYEDESNSTRIKNIIDGIWLALVTMATVGYGDYVPFTILGKVIASIAAILGMLVIALPVAILGNNFQDVYKEKLESQLIQAIKTKIINDTEITSADQKEIHFMNERLTNIKEYNNKIMKLLNESDEMYKTLTTDLKKLYREIYKEYGEEILEKDSKVIKVGTETNMSKLIDIRKKLHKAKQRIKVSSILTKMGRENRRKQTLGSLNSQPSEEVIQKEEPGPLPKSKLPILIELNNDESPAIPPPTIRNNKFSRQNTETVLKSNSLESENKFIKFKNKNLPFMKQNMLPQLITAKNDGDDSFDDIEIEDNDEKKTKIILPENLPYYTKFDEMIQLKESTTLKKSKTIKKGSLWKLAEAISKNEKMLKKMHLKIQNGDDTPSKKSKKANNENEINISHQVVKIDYPQSKLKIDEKIPPYLTFVAELENSNNMDFLSPHLSNIKDNEPSSASFKKKLMNK